MLINCTELAVDFTSKKTFNRIELLKKEDDKSAVIAFEAWFDRSEKQQFVDMAKDSSVSGFAATERSFLYALKAYVLDNLN